MPSTSGPDTLLAAGLFCVNRSTQLRRFVMLGAAALAAACATAPVPNTEGEAWADYSLMGTSKSATLWADGAPASKFEWAAIAGNESHIYWGNPAHWPPKLHEKFLLRGDWIFLDGWWDNGTYYTLRVKQDELCNANCQDCALLAREGAQHYAKRIVPSQAYCLRAEGTVTEQSSGKQFNFMHVQTYAPAAPCQNSTITDQRCIQQHEVWWDSNGTPFRKKLDRVVHLAKGLGPGFVNSQSFPAPWRAEMRRESPGTAPEQPR